MKQNHAVQMRGIAGVSSKSFALCCGRAHAELDFVHLGSHVSCHARYLCKHLIQRWQVVGQQTKISPIPTEFWPNTSNVQIASQQS
jgi:hypothetical protein